jgi:DNA-nicking Smr family endonuclease
VDLHGLRAYEVEALLDRLLTNWSRQQPGAILRIITGKGNRSQDGPVLLGVVREVLQDELGGRVQEMVLDSNGGGWVVRVGKG